MSAVTFSLLFCGKASFFFFSLRPGFCFALHSRTEKLKPKLRQLETTLLSDSEVVFHRLSSEKVSDSLVSRRIKEVKKMTNQHLWRFCPSASNPADIFCRGIDVSALVDLNADVNASPPPPPPPPPSVSFFCISVTMVISAVEDGYLIHPLTMPQNFQNYLPEMNFFLS